MQCISEGKGVTMPAMKAYCEVEVLLVSFVTSALVGSEC